MNQSPSQSAAVLASVEAKWAARVERLAKACELTLLFHSSSPWDHVKRTQWDERMNTLLGPCEDRFDTKSNEATKRNLCNAVRSVLTIDERRQDALQTVTGKKTQ